MTETIKCIGFQDVVKFEYDKTLDEFSKLNPRFQDVVKFEYDKTKFYPNYQAFNVLGCC